MQPYAAFPSPMGAMASQAAPALPSSSRQVSGNSYLQNHLQLGSAQFSTVAVPIVATADYVEVGRGVEAAVAVDLLGETPLRPGLPAGHTMQYIPCWLKSKTGYLGSPRLMISTALLAAWLPSFPPVATRLSVSASL